MVLYYGGCPWINESCIFLCFSGRCLSLVTLVLTFYEVMVGWGLLPPISLQLDMVDIGDGHGFSIIWMESRLACLLMGVFVLNAGFFGAWMDGRMALFWRMFSSLYTYWLGLVNGW
jgi:hypothetical protein